MVRILISATSRKQSGCTTAPQPAQLSGFHLSADVSASSGRRDCRRNYPRRPWPSPAGCEAARPCILPAVLLGMGLGFLECREPTGCTCCIVFRELVQPISGSIKSLRDGLRLSSTHSWVLPVPDCMAVLAGLKMRTCMAPATPFSGVVGAAGFEPTTFCAQGRRATRLRYAPPYTALTRRVSTSGPAGSKAQFPSVRVSPCSIRRPSRAAPTVAPRP
jgi:hypothetical protein